MKDFITRNKPIFVIALITALVFIGIIILAQRAPGVTPTLKKVENVQLIEPYTYTKGPKSPKLTLVIFSDFECPACKDIHPLSTSLAEKYKAYMLVAYRHFPLPYHTDSKMAAIAAQAAGAQNKFWEYAEVLFDNNQSLKREDLVKYAEELGLNVEKFKNDLNDPVIAANVDNDLATATKIGLQGTPSFILNKELLDFSTPNDFEKAIVEKLKEAGIENPNDEANNTGAPDLLTVTPATEETTESKKLGNLVPITINYSSDGFIPNNIKLLQGEAVKFVNTTDKEIAIRQLISSYKEFDKPVTLQPGSSFTLVLSKPDLWTFKENSVRHYGSIFVAAN